VQHIWNVEVNMTTFIIKPSLTGANNHMCDYKAIKMCSTIFRKECRAKLQKMTIRRIAYILRRYCCIP
jgi:hypothetical protein